MASIFTKIINGEIPSYKVAETEQYYAFLDIRPLMKGHTLVIPKVEVDYIFDLEDDVLAGMMVFAKRVGTAIEKTIVCNRISIGVFGLEVPHAHIHLIPMNQMSDVNFKKQPLELSREVFEEIAAAIQANFR
ncbi:MAG: histidine triad (HIT) family protein [Cognaticolwellia sp.]|jgi:histidine triad (HIT) family protein